MPEATNELRDMSFDFLSFVTAPDNPEAHIVLLKARPDSTDTRNPGEKDDAAKVGSMSGKQPQSTAAAPPDGGDATALDITDPKVVEALLEQNALLKERNEKLEDIAEALAEQNEQILKAASGDLDDEDFDDEDYDDDEDEDDADEAPVTKSKPAAKPAEEDIVKNHPAFKAMRAEMERMAKALDETTAVAKAAEEARVDEIIKGRAAQLSNLGETDEVFGVLRKAFDALDVDTFTKVEGLLQKAARVATEGEVFKQVGSSARPAPSKIDDLLEKSASDSGDGLTAYQRLRKQFRDHPELYAEVSADDSNSIGRAL